MDFDQRVEELEERLQLLREYEKRAIALKKRIAVLGVTHGLTQTKLAERMGIPGPALSYALTGTRIQPERLDAVEAALDEFENESEKLAA